MTNTTAIKNNVHDLAILGGKPYFTRPKSTSNILTPDIEKFLKYSRIFYDSGQYTNNGPVAQLLEKRLAAFHKTKYCLAFSSGFWAIALAIRCLALPTKTEIIMPSLTYRRMAEIASWIPLKPNFCEVDADTLAMTAETVKPCINNNTALILGTHPIVNCCNPIELEDLGKEHGIPVLFDSVESIYETFAGKKIGGFGEAECFSLHACKLLNGFGGGYITTNNSRLVVKLKSLRAFGFTAKDRVSIVGGLNAKLNEIHAALALASIDDVEKQIALNKERYITYQKSLQNIPGIKILDFDENELNGYKNIVAELTDEWPLCRDITLQILNAENILARAYYHPPLHQKKMLFEHVKSKLPETDRLACRFVNLPCGQQVTQRDIVNIVEFIKFLFVNADKLHCILQPTG